MKINQKSIAAVTASIIGVTISFTSAYALETGDFRELLRTGLLGGGVGAISAGVSGGKAGTGALVGAGSNILGSVLMGLLSGPSSSTQTAYTQPVSYQPVYSQPVRQPVYYDEPAPVYYAPQPASSYSYEDPNKKILKSGLLGAGVGAISAEVSGGKAGTGALVGAGTQIIGGALADYLTAPSQPQTNQPVYYASRQQSSTYAAPTHSLPTELKKRIIRKYDSNGKIVSEEEFWE